MVKHIILFSKIILLASVVSVQSVACDALFFEADSKVSQTSSSATLPQAECIEGQLDTLDRQLTALYAMKGRRLLEAGVPFEAVVYFKKARRYDLVYQVYWSEYENAISYGYGLEYYEKANMYKRKHEQCMINWKAEGCY